VQVTPSNGRKIQVGGGDPVPGHHLLLELDGRDLRRSLERSVSMPGDQYLRSTFAAKQANSTNSRRW